MFAERGHPPMYTRCGNMKSNTPIITKYAINRTHKKTHLVQFQISLLKLPLGLKFKNTAPCEYKNSRTFMFFGCKATCVEIYSCRPRGIMGKFGGEAAGTDKTPIMTQPEMPPPRSSVILPERAESSSPHSAPTTRTPTMQLHVFIVDEQEEKTLILPLICLHSSLGSLLTCSTCRSSSWVEEG